MDGQGFAQQGEFEFHVPSIGGDAGKSSRKISVGIPDQLREVGGVQRYLAIPLLILAAATGATAETAYRALEAIKAAKGDAVLDQLIEARGESGSPQPQSWTIVMIDAAARGGVREFVVAGGSIQSERTPVRGYSGQSGLPPINFSRLNLDSDGAFAVAEKEAVGDKVGFNTVDYALRTDLGSGSPVWVVRLFDYMGAPVGGLEVSAESGKLTQDLRIDPDARVAGSDGGDETETVVVRGSGGQVVDPRLNEKDEMGGVFGFVKRRAAYDANKVKNVTLRTVGTVQKFLVGKDTVSPDNTPAE